MTTVAQPEGMAHSALSRGDAIAAVFNSIDEYRCLDDVKTVALALAELGIHVGVIPRGDAKRPFDYRTPEQRAADDAACGFQSPRSWYLATTDSERLVSLIDRCAQFTNELPNLGMHLAPSGVLVADADTDAAVCSLRHWMWNTFGIDAYHVRSPGKFENGEWIHRNGVHAYFFLPEGVNADDFRTTFTESNVLPEPEGRDGWELKYRTGMGVLLPLSVRSEGAYRWNDAPIHAVPDALLGMLQKPYVPEREWDDSEDAQLFRQSVEEALADVTWSEVFEGIAYEDGEDADGCLIFTRHGGSPRSAVVHQGCARLGHRHCATIHSTALLDFFQEILDKNPGRAKSFSMWECLAAFQFKGDMGAVARHYGFSRPSSSADWTTVFAPADKPFTVSVSSGAPAPTTVYADACAHGIPSRECVPCLRARRLAIAAQPTPPAFATTWFDAAKAGASRV